MQAVTITNTGECNPVAIKQTRGRFSYEKKRLHLHYREKKHGLIVLSTNEPQLLQCESTPLFTFSLPPPLNAYVYPTPLFIGRVGAQEELVDLRPAEFVEICATMDAQASVKEETVAVYDVPAVPFDSVVDDVEYPMSEEEEEEESDQDEEIDEDIEEDDWELDDEENNAIVP